MTLRGRIEAVFRGEPPEDNESPTSEDGMNAADWMLTFRKTYNIKVPESSIMGRYRIKSMGGVFASASNKHLHVFEVICSRHLRKLFVWTGNVYYAVRANDHWRFVCQHLRRENGMFSGFRGAMAEQFYWTNWGSFGSSCRKPDFYVQKGSATLFTAIWCVAAVALAAEDNP